jgi:NTP pyrophosphatase (non-canonical NTP hydrolase)
MVLNIEEIMTEEQYVLTKTAEELGELAEACLRAQKALLKTVYFGWSEISPKTLKTNYEAVSEELSDVYLWVGNIESSIGIDLLPKAEYVRSKLQTYSKYLEIAIENGRVNS